MTGEMRYWATNSRTATPVSQSPNNGPGDRHPDWMARIDAAMQGED